MAQEFQTGDIVQLKSGGPTMTVRALLETGPYEGEYSCQWFAGKKLEAGHFLPESLKRVTNDAE